MSGRVAVLWGGPSAEAEVSRRSAANVHAELVRRRPETLLMEYSEDLPERLRREKVSTVFLMMHGAPGEDGTVQGLLELMGIPYTYSGVLTSALCMDKTRTKEILGFYGLPVLPGALISERNLEHAEEIVGPGFGWPVFVKPNAGGSSVGARKVETAAELRKVLADSLPVHGPMLVEPYVAGRELTVGVLEEPDGSLRSLPVIELRPKAEFYDYGAKYTEGMTEFLVPAPLSPEVERGVRETAEQAAEFLGCRSALRVDMILEGDVWHILEVNTIPGMTRTSDLPKAAAAAGIGFGELVERILDTACLKAGFRR